jgi:hypothetical protein
MAKKENDRPQKEDSTQVTSSKDAWTLADLVELNVLYKPSKGDIPKDENDRN